MAEAKGVLILAETREGGLVSMSRELLGIGGKLAADLGEPLAAAILGSGVASLAAELASLGAQRVYLVDSPLLSDYTTEAYTEALEKVTREANPNILLMGQTSIGRDLAPRLAARLDTGLAMDCINLEIDPQSKLLVQTRPVHGGDAWAIYLSEKTTPQMATVRAKAFDEASPQPGRQAEVVTVDPGLSSARIRTRLADRVSYAQVGEVRVEEAQIVVSGGQGLGSKENFNRYIVELARVLGGVATSSRPVVDKEWTDNTWWIGLTGRIIAPNLYVAVGIHGASQHMAGCAGAKTIVAINKDSDAPIFKYARFGIVGDCNEIMPVLIEKCREVVGVKA